MMRVDWVLSAWTSGVQYSSPDLSAIVNELVQSGLWSHADPITFVMERKMLQGIKVRAEARAS